MADTTTVASVLERAKHLNSLAPAWRTRLEVQTHVCRYDDGEGALWVTYRAYVTEQSGKGRCEMLQAETLGDVVRGAENYILANYKKPQ